MTDDLTAEIRAAARDVLRRFAPRSGGDRDVASAGATSPIWQAITQMGAIGLEVPDSEGGAGRSFADVCAVLEEAGRVVLPGALTSCTVLGIGAILQDCGTGRRRTRLASVLAGDTTVTAALTGPDGTPGSVSVDAIPDGGGFALHGVAGFVPDAGAAEAVAVAARLPGSAGGDSLFLVPMSARGLTRQHMPTVDHTREMWSLALDGVRVALADALGAPGHAYPAIARLLDRAAVATAADSLGSAERALQLTVDHLTSRRQFGHPIGSFQALRHRCATMFLQVQMARAAVEHAALVIDDEWQAPAATSIAKSYCGEFCSLIAAEGTQMHGAIGFTAEHEMNLHLKRQNLNAALFGDTLWHRQRIARLALPAAAGARGSG